MNHAEILAIYPDAEFSPGEPAPIGMRVSTPTGAGVVVGQEPDSRPARHSCPSCQCTEANPTAGWWHIRLDDWWWQQGRESSYRAKNPIKPTHERVVEVAYPPSLSRLLEEK